MRRSPRSWAPPGTPGPPYLNDQGAVPPGSLTASSLRRSGFIIYDQMAIDDCYALHGYRKVSK
jgi:hypothetical protein